MERKATFFISITIAFLASMSSWAVTYIVQKKEVLSKIAGKVYPGPVWGKSGSLKILLALNPQIKDSNLIRPGDRIELGSILSALPTRTPARESPSQTQPPPAAVSSAIQDDSPSSRLGLEWGASNFRIDSRDRVNGGTALLLSNTNLSARFTWDLRWNSDWTTRLRWELQREQIRNATHSSISLTDASGTRSDFEAGLIRSWNETNRTLFSLAETQQIYEQASTATEIAIDRVQVLELKVGHEIDVFTLKSAKAGLGAEAALSLPATGTGYSIEKGYAMTISAYLEHKLDRWAIEGRIYYEIDWQHASTLDQKTQSLGSYFGVSRRLGD